VKSEEVIKERLEKWSKWKQRAKKDEEWVNGVITALRWVLDLPLNKEN